jgi:hypothetical protein
MMSITAYYQWLKQDWAKIGFIVAIFLFAFLMVLVREDDFVLFLILLQTPLYMLHETEEYVFPGGFGKFFNMDIMGLATENKPLDENFIFTINISLVWVLLPIFGLLATVDYQFGIWILYFSLFAGLAHIALGIRAKKLYNPGLVVSLLLNIPVSLGSIAYLAEQGVIENAFLNPHLFIGIGINALLPIIGMIVYRQHMKSLASNI